jgi:hypothetical protein
MTAQNAEELMAQLSHAGLRVSLASSFRLAVAPSSHLTADLRDLIRNSKALLIDWLTAANDAASHDLGLERAGGCLSRSPLQLSDLHRRWAGIKVRLALRGWHDVVASVLRLICRHPAMSPFRR